MPQKMKTPWRSYTLILAAELTKIEPGQRESNLALVYRALIHKAISGDVAACKMILDGLDECDGQIAENESKEERQSTDFPSNLETLSMEELQRLYLNEINRSPQLQN